MIGIVICNSMEIEDGYATGKVLGEIVDADRKAALKKIVDEEAIAIDQSIAVGDGANDLPILNLAGLGVAYHAKLKVRLRQTTRFPTSAGRNFIFDRI